MIEGTNAVESCPITRGNLTTMTKTSFEAICASKQAQTFQGNFVNQYCQVCRGENIPAELTFTDGIATGGLNVGKPLSKAASGKSETCALCNQHRSLIKSHGKRMCNGCSQVVSMIKNNPQLVIEIMREYGGISLDAANDTSREKGDLAVKIKCLEDRLAQSSLQVTWHVEQLLEKEEKISDLQKQLEESNADCEKYLAELKVALEAPNATHAEQRLQDEIIALRNDVSAKTVRITDLNAHIQQMRSMLDNKDQHLAASSGELERLKREASIEKARAANCYDKSKIMVLLVDLAQAHIEGRVAVKADCFKELRKAATA